LLVKKIRSKLRLLTGRFQTSSKERDALLQKGDILSLLKTHSSTKERIEFYSELNSRIYSLSIKSILDLGAGLNPIAVANQSVIYYAVDIKRDELQLIGKFFKKNKIRGKTIYCDLRHLDCIFPKADICLIFKVFDVLETGGHKLAEKIIRDTDCKYFIVSFSTKTLSGQPMNHPQRGWIERLLSRLGFKFEVFKSNNEIFYLFTKSS